MAGRGTMTERSPGTWRLPAYLGRDVSGRPVQVTRTFKGGKPSLLAWLSKLKHAGTGQGSPERRRAA